MQTFGVHTPYNMNIYIIMIYYIIIYELYINSHIVLCGAAKYVLSGGGRHVIMWRTPIIYMAQAS